jgi:hypothetical protein
MFCSLLSPFDVLPRAELNRRRQPFFGWPRRRKFLFVF